MRIRSYVLAGVSGLLLIFVFPRPLGLPVELGWLAWIALLPLLLTLPNTSYPQAFWRGAATGFIAYPGILYWIVYCMVTYAGMSRIIAWLVLLLLIAMMASFLGLFMVLTRFLVKRANFPLLLSAPCAWTAVELLRTYVPFGGFPWTLLGLSQHQTLPVIQIAEFTGVYGVSFLIVVVNAALASAFPFPGLKPWATVNREPREARGEPSTVNHAFAWRELLLAALLLAGDLGFGWLRMRQVDQAFTDRPKLKLALVQGNIDQGVKWDETQFWNSLETHLSITRRLLQDKPDLLIWPEAALTVIFNEHWDAHSPVIEKLSGFDVDFLVGSLREEEQDGHKAYYNSAYLLSPKAQAIWGRYDKIHLVPFGEYVPLQSLFFFADAIAKGNTGNTTPGREIVVFQPPGYRFGCVICYEVIYGNLVRQFVKQGAQFMTTITNDAWFGQTSAPYQHHANLAFRAVENRVFFARAANTGVSSLVNPLGKVEVASEIYQPAALSAEIRLGPAWTTFYTLAGDVFAYLCTLAVLGGLIIGWRRNVTHR